MIMKINKEEKSLYNFLNIVNTIFGKSTYRTTIAGRGTKLYFFTEGYAGVFEDKDRNTLAGGNYDFSNSLYELKQTPSKSFVLDEYELDDKDFENVVEQGINTIEVFAQCKNWKLEYDKPYEYKISKIAEETGVWLKDSDLKYLDKFKNAELFQLEDNIIIKASGLTDGDVSNVTTVLVFVGNSHPNVADSTQQKMDVNEPKCLLLEGNKDMLLEDSDVEIMEDDPYPDVLEDDSDGFNYTEYDDDTQFL